MAPKNLNQLRALHFALEKVMRGEELVGPIGSTLNYPPSWREEEWKRIQEIAKRRNFNLLWDEVRLFSITLCSPFTHTGPHAHAHRCTRACRRRHTRSFVRPTLISFWAGLTAAWWSTDGGSQPKQSPETRVDQHPWAIYMALVPKGLDEEIVYKLLQNP